MSLANRLAAVIPARSNRGCVTCHWLEELSPADRAAWDAWIDERRSLTQLWEIAGSDENHPLDISITGLRHHVRNHHKASQ